MKKVLTFTLFLIISLGLGIYSGIRNAEDNTFQIIELPEIIDEVKVFRDSYGIPSILARNLNDLFLVQGYETARDRTWQLEFFHALANGRLSELFGSDMVQTDIFIHSIGFNRMADLLVKNMSSSVHSYLSSYVTGINLYYSNHAFSLPWEFQLLDIEPNYWSVEDTLAMYGVVSYLFSFSNAFEELFFGYLINEIGAEFTNSLYNYQNSEIKEYLLNQTTVPTVPNTIITDPIADLFEMPSRERFGNSAFVLSGNLTARGFPIISVHPSNILQVPNLWYQVNLKLNIGFSSQGFTVPGIPFVMIGHNNFVSWGFNPSNIDEVDLIYLISNTTHYWDGIMWDHFEIRSETIMVANSKNTNLDVKLSKFGPILNVSGFTYAIQWSYYEITEENLFMDAMFGLNSANSLDTAYRAIKNIASPNLNFLMADISGNIARMQSGLVPIRFSGFGIVPLNGSQINTVWSGYIDRNSRIYEINPSGGYYILADQPINIVNDTRYSGFYDNPARSERMTQLIESKYIFDSQFAFNIADVITLQNDIKDISAVPILSGVEAILSNFSFSSDQEEIESLFTKILDWDYDYSKNSSLSSIYHIFKYYLSFHLMHDQIKLSLINELQHSLLSFLNAVLTSNIFSGFIDDQSTSKIETLQDIILSSFESAYEFLSNKFGPNSESWDWEHLHTLNFNHIIGHSIPLDARVNLGPYGVPGSDNTVTSYQLNYQIQSTNSLFSIQLASTGRMILEISPNWSQNLISVSPGTSGHVTSDHYNDVVNNWLQGVYYTWAYNTVDIILLGELSAEFVKGA